MSYEQSESQEQIERATKLLAEAGFKMSVGGCGCCNSPWVRLEKDGDMIIGEGSGSRDYADFNMFRENAP